MVSNSAWILFKRDIIYETYYRDVRERISTLECDLEIFFFFFHIRFEFEVSFSSLLIVFIRP